MASGCSWIQLPRLVLWLDDHLPDPVAILTGNCECLINPFHLPCVCQHRRERLGVRVEQVESFLSLMVRSAHVENREFFAPHCRPIQRYDGSGMNTCERDAAGITRKLNGLAGGMFSGRTVNRAVH